MQKNLCIRISNSLSPETTFMWTSGFCMNTYILTEGRKTFLKENYAIVLDSCYLLTNHMLNIELNVMLIVLMEFAYIRHF